jgi:hypothetical protein
MHALMPTELIIALVGVAGTVVAGFLGFINGRSKIRIDSVSARAAATLARAQATDIGFENLLSLYHELKQSNEQLRQEVAALSASNADLKSTIEHFGEVIRILPTEYQALFRPKGKPSPKASSGE